MLYLPHKPDSTLQAVSAIEAEEGFFVIYGISAVRAYVGILHNPGKTSLFSFIHEFPGIALYVFREFLKVLRGLLKVFKYPVYLFFVVRDY